MKNLPEAMRTELKQNAVTAVIIASIGMLIYIILRFKSWKYGFAAVVGVAHDVLMVLAFYAIFGYTINNPFIAAILTVVGYSINDKVDVAAAISLSLLNNRNGVKDANVTEFTVEPYVRYTFAEAGIAKFFVDGYVGFGSYKPKGVDATTTFKVGVRPGVKVALSDDVCLVSTLGNLGYKTVKDTYNQFGLNLDNAITFGIYFNF